MDQLLQKYEKIVTKEDPNKVASSSGSDSEEIHTEFNKREINEKQKLKAIDHHFQDWRSALKFKLQAKIMFRPKMQIDKKIFGSKRIGAQEDTIDFAQRIVKVDYDAKDLFEQAFKRY